ncbi:MAG: cobalamin-dependent protein [Spirochaetales bacterium]|nr:cobalamin-dependent protein [Spirochaetales bacterium]
MDVDLTCVRPYGDTKNDGKVQLSFTLPLPASKESQEAAKRLAEAMGMKNPEAVHMQDLGESFSFHVLYGPVSHSVDASSIHVAEVEHPVMDFYATNAYIAEKLQRTIRVVGACTGNDAHTVGLDAIMNMKGYAGEYGLERYSGFETRNLGSQVPNEELIAQALDMKADAILVSQVVTQKDTHIHNLTALTELLEAEEIRDDFLLVVGGPRINHALALELGFDAGFGAGTLPYHVASYIAQAIVEREKHL